MSTPHPASTVPALPSARESVKSWAIRALLNRLPSYRRAGGKVIFISDDLTLARVRVKHSWLTHGQKGAIFGGSLYASIDPCYVIMLPSVRGLGQERRHRIREASPIDTLRRHCLFGG